MKRLLLLFLLVSLECHAQLTITNALLIGANSGSAQLVNNQVFTGTNTFSTWLAGNGGGLTNGSPSFVSTNSPFPFAMLTATSANSAKWDLSPRIFCGAIQNTLTTVDTTTRYAPISGLIGSSLSRYAYHVFSKDITFTNFVVRQSLVGAGTNVTYYVYTNGANTSLTVSINADGQTVQGSDTTHSVTVLAGTTVCISYTGNNPSSGSAITTWTLEGY